jgi:hypothetical protein
MAEDLMLVTRIVEVTGSNLDLRTGCPDVDIRVFPQALQENVG